jgi:putative ABC transport system permease protein
MTFLAVKNLFEERGRLLVACGGVALAAMLVLVLWGISVGTIRQAGALVANADADVWVVQQGFTDIAHGFSVLPEELEQQLEGIEGVRSVHPITVSAREVSIDGQQYSVQVVGYDPADGVGGPWAWADTERHPGGEEIVVDETFARVSGLSPGDTLPFGGTGRRIVALSAESTGFASWMAFARYDEVREMSRLRDAVNFFALRVPPGQADDVIERTESQLDDVTAFSRAQFLANNEREVRDGVQPVLYVMLGVAFVVGLAVVGLTIFTATVEKTREYGVLSAIGADLRTLTGVVLRQAALVSLAGFAAGAALTPAAAAVIRQVAPRVEIAFPLSVFPAVGAAAVVMALLASYVPVRRLAKLDPAAVFRA